MMTTMRTACILAATLSVLCATTCLAAATSWQEPAFCHGINCPQFTSLCNASGFEIRRYPAAEWVSIDFEGPGVSLFQEAEHDGFMHLFNYITGANAASEKIKMTAPVLNRIVPGAGPNCNSTITVSFFVPFKFQNVAPTPTSPRVYLRHQPELTVAVRSFGGWVRGWNASAVPELEALGDALNKAGVSFSQAEEWVAQYNGPFTLFNRHNEVWYPVANSTKLTC